ncbi:hypothetical protein IF2G_04241 [Cordyceps javanica]|nr:hypothetical protein IF2G_04241 [Cordyceps javanica]
MSLEDSCAAFLSSAQSCLVRVCVCACVRAFFARRIQRVPNNAKRGNTKVECPRIMMVVMGHRKPDYYSFLCRPRRATMKTVGATMPMVITDAPEPDSRAYS